MKALGGAPEAVGRVLATKYGERGEGDGGAYWCPEVDERRGNTG